MIVDVVESGNADGRIPDQMSDSSRVALHKEPAWKTRGNAVVQVDLAPHGMPGKYEELWVERAHDAGASANFGLRWDSACSP